VARESRELYYSEVRRLKQLEEEKWRLKSLVAEFTLSNEALKLVISKKW
jgi:hypothetical protein